MWLFYNTRKVFICELNTKDSTILLAVIYKTEKKISTVYSWQRGRGETSVNGWINQGDWDCHFMNEI